jgi:hypothetical protein
MSTQTKYRPTFTPARLIFLLVLLPAVAVLVGAAFYLMGFDTGSQAFMPDGTPIVVTGPRSAISNGWWTR